MELAITSSMASTAWASASARSPPEGRHGRQIRAGDEQRVIVIGLKLDLVGDHFSPKWAMTSEGIP
jgi:hypothetical protein